MLLDSNTPFVAKEINDFLFNRINGVSYRENKDIQISELAYIPLLHYGFDKKVHKGEIICNKHISEKVIGVFKTLYNKRYQIESIKLIDDFNANDDASMKANNTSSFNYRNITSGNRLSYHALGLAIDINPLYNPYVKYTNGGKIVLPKESEPFVDRAKRFAHKITLKDSAYAVFKEYGFSWGGEWDTLKDYQHFEIKL